MQCFQIDPINRDKSTISLHCLEILAYFIFFLSIILAQQSSPLNKHPVHISNTAASLPDLPARDNCHYETTDKRFRQIGGFAEGFSILETQPTGKH
jgi:hypothetical protein